jgi:hypothetical protein
LVEEEQEEEHTIESDYQLYLQLCTCTSDLTAQSLILRTNFQDESF